MAVFGLIGAGIVAMVADVAGSDQTRPFTRLVFTLLSIVELAGSVALVVDGAFNVLQGAL